MIALHHLTFSYDSAEHPALEDVTLTIAAGTRCLLVGPNGAGKTTLLRLLAGKHLIPADAARINGHSTFHDSELTKRVAFLGGTFQFDVDIEVAAILSGLNVVDSSRRDRLIELLGVEQHWRMHRISDGQRRRVQLLLGLLYPADVLLLDEITTDLDLIARADLLAFLREESEFRGATILYATHILDRLEDWATHLVVVKDGHVSPPTSLTAIPELQSLYSKHASAPLSRYVEGLLRRNE